MRTTCVYRSMCEMTSSTSPLTVTPGHTFPILTSLLHRDNKKLISSSRYIAVLVIKAVKEQTESDNDLAHEVYNFISAYCSVLGTGLGFQEDEFSILLKHLCDLVRQIDRSEIVLQESHVPKRGKGKKRRADLNVESSREPSIGAEIHAAGLKALNALLIADPQSVSESSFKMIANTVSKEVVQVNIQRYELKEESDTCVYANSQNRKLLYKLLLLVAKYPVHQKHRPLHVALNVFPDICNWDNFHPEYQIPTFCRNALMTLELITDPIVHPKPLILDYSVTSDNRVEPLSNHETDSTDITEKTKAAPVATENHVSHDSGEPVVRDSQSTDPSPDVNQVSQGTATNVPPVSDAASLPVHVVVEEAKTTDLITLSDDSCEETLPASQLMAPDPSTATMVDPSPRTAFKQNFNPVLNELKSRNTETDMQCDPSGDTTGETDELMELSVNDVLASGGFI